jgi:putative peptide zinc metalloprotease protein
MATVALKLPNDQARELLAFRLRHDLIAVVQGHGADSMVVVKDPVQLAYFQFTAHEWRIAELVGSSTSFDDLAEKVKFKLPGLEVTRHELALFVSRLESDGLIVSQKVGRASVPFRKSNPATTTRWLNRLTSFYSIKFPGFYPAPLLKWLDPIGLLLFSRIGALTFAFCSMAALVLLFSQFEEVVDRMPTLSSWLAWNNVLTLVVAFWAVKILHELGHGLACRRFGAECHEMGVMLLMFTPCLYCDVSDAWMLKSRWHRIVISAAGIYVELFLASICVFLWYFSEPGWFNALCLNILVIGSVNTLLANGNPLLKYDGYYVLIDLLRCPNLQQESRAAFWAPLKNWVSQTGHNPTLTPAWFPVFGLACILYRFVILVGISWLFYGFCKQHDAISLGRLAVIFVWASFLVPAVSGSVARWRSEMKTGKISPIRFTIVGLLCAGLIVLIFNIPWPSTVNAPALTQASDAKVIFVAVEGELRELTPSGSKVEKGDRIARLANRPLEQKHLLATQQVAQIRQRLEHLRLQANQNDEVSKLIQPTEAELAMRERNLITIEEDLADLDILAPQSGFILPLEPRPTSTERQWHLTSWSGQPLDPSNLNCWLNKAQPLCLIGNPNELEVVAWFAEVDLSEITTGASARIQLHQFPEQILIGKVVEVSTEVDRSPPANLLASGAVEVLRDGASSRTLQTLYRVRISLDGCPSFVTCNSLGAVSVEIGKRTLWQRTQHWAGRTFRLGQ